VIKKKCDTTALGLPGPFFVSSTTTTAFFSVFLAGPSHLLFSGLKMMPLFLHLTGLFSSHGADALLRAPSPRAAGNEYQDRKGKYRAKSYPLPPPWFLSLLVGCEVVT